MLSAHTWFSDSFLSVQDVHPQKSKLDIESFVHDYLRQGSWGFCLGLKPSREDGMP